MATEYDVVVIGCGPGGERAAVEAAKAGAKVAILEKEHVVGGTSVNWGTIPSKTLRESALHVYALTRQKLHGIRAEIPDEITVADFMHRERQVVQRELELINRSLSRFPLELFHGQGRLIGTNQVAIIGAGGQTRMVLQTKYIVIATGTKPNRPPDVPFDETCVFDSDTILGLPRLPRSLLVLGAGVIGVEYAAIFAALGIEVTLLDTREMLLPYLDREVAEILERELRGLGMVITHDDHYQEITRIDGSPPRVCCHTRKGNIIEADAMLYCVGRDGSSAGLGLKSAGIEPTSRGLIEVNEHFQTVQPNIYAVGDIIGYPALASTSMEQGRRAVRHALGIPGVTGRTGMLPFAIYSIPEVSYIGETEEGLRDSGTGYVVGRGQYGMNPRGQIIGDTGGVLKLLCDVETMKLLGVHIVGFNASELIHIGQAFLRAGATATEIAETLYNYPTLSDLYRHAAWEAIAAQRRRQSDQA
jgi:NAD(P) transhydrogenase